MAAILSQIDDDDNEYVVAYASRKLRGPQRNWAATQGECYAVVWAVTEEYRSYLWGTKFTVITDHHNNNNNRRLTDHASLKWLMTCQELKGALARWALKLQEYDFEILYRPGTQHTNVDALTRCGDPDEPVDRISEFPHTPITPDNTPCTSDSDTGSEQDPEYEPVPTDQAIVNGQDRYTCVQIPTLEPCIYTIDSSTKTETDDPASTPLPIQNPVHHTAWEEYEWTIMI